MAESDVSLVNKTSQNSFINGVGQLAGAIGAIAKDAVSVYSSFSNAKTAAKLAKAQGGSEVYQPTAQQFLDADKRNNFIVYAAIGVALLGTMALVYKAVK